MEVGVYAVEAAVEESHWWFVGRRRRFAREIAGCGLAPDARILDVGTSTGTNLRLLRDLGFRRVRGVDSSPQAIRYCAEKGLGLVELGEVCALPFADASFDLVLATDIIEHVEDDGRALAELTRILAPGGRLLLTVPAFRSLWGTQDEVAQHRRRYRMKPLLRQIAAVGLCSQRSYYFNYLLFAPIWLTRRIIGLSGRKLASENQLNTPLLNRLLSAVFRLDLATAPILRPPFGVSIFVLARKEAA